MRRAVIFSLIAGGIIAGALGTVAVYAPGAVAEGKEMVERAVGALARVGSLVRSQGRESAGKKVVDPGEGVLAVPSASGCNGHVLLCDRRFDSIAIAATHNSMSNIEDEFLLVNHSKGIIPQLEAGYRGLLIDLYYGIDSEWAPVVVTDLTTFTSEEREQLVKQLGEAVVQSAEELSQRDLRDLDIGYTRGVYLCHQHCEIGSTRFSTALEGIRGWLEDNPREVLLIIIEDHVTAEDVADAFQEAGLAAYLHTQAIDAPWPTLLEMIDSGRRLVVMAENDTGGAPWHHDAFTFIQDTPHTFETVDQFNCAPHRGRPDSPLFMINHWVTPAVAETGAIVNSAQVLNQRIALCQEERGSVPNIIGVDFYDQGDALAVVAALNGVQ